jgi:hypothetical protein
MRPALPLLLAFAAIPALAGHARAGSLDTPQCRQDLPRAAALVDAVAARDRKGPVRDPAQLCRLLRLNERDMAESRAIMARCLTGHDLGENVGQMDASLEDVRALIRQRCV